LPGSIASPGAAAAPGRFFVKRLAHYCDFDGAGEVGAGGVSGWVAREPEPVVLGGGIVRGAVLLVVVVEEPLLAVLLLLFQPAMIRKPISSSTATPAIQPHIPPALSSRRITGSLSRGSVSLNLGSVKRGSVMASSLVRDASRRLE
jgi:hypothetical protein